MATDGNLVSNDWTKKGTKNGESYLTTDAARGLAPAVLKAARNVLARKISVDEDFAERNKLKASDVGSKQLSHLDGLSGGERHSLRVAEDKEARRQKMMGGGGPTGFQCSTKGEHICPQTCDSSCDYFTGL